jgi:hypothetical protein
MPESSQEFYDRVQAAAAESGGRLAVPPDILDSEIFPFETDGLRTRAFDPPVLPEPPRAGEGDKPCHRCGRTDDVLWANERWLLTRSPISSLPFSAMLEPREHVDFGDLSAEMAAEMGQLIVACERSARSLAGVSRCHVYVWGDGSSHAHVWFLARPEGLLQLRGSSLGDWTDLLPPRPAADLRADQRLVVASLIEQVGGRSHLD